MANVVLMMSLSLDGFMEGVGRSLDWQLVDDEVHAEFNDVLRPAGAFLDGRVTFEMMAEFWPTADADPASPPPMVEFAGIWREMPKVVFSRTLSDPLPWSARVVREVVPAEIEALKASAGGDLFVGGAELAGSFLALDLVDELRLYIHPVVLGAGRPLFGALERPRGWTLEQARPFGNGVVLLHYSRA